ncbi:HAD family hydrolase [Endozoicomonas numazuensis]|uniref:HAD family hydrolase n=1 Tax=Endozoicomonas numazuensis TaxID=1137799 RepID=UPI00068F0D02|nr:HAD family hydrolase [Endozoicomonas numazuensis]
MNIIFDLDDTLHDKKATLNNYADYLLNDRLSRFELCQHTFKHEFVTQNTIIQPKSQVFSTMASRFGFSAQLRDDLLKEFDSSLHEFSVAFDGALDSLERLKNNGSSIGCITNGRDFFQRNKIRALGLEHFFDFVLTSGGVGIKKPDLKIFRMGLEKFTQCSHSVYFCGDSLLADIRPAKELGMVTIWKANTSEKSNFVDYLFDNFNEFDAISQKIFSTK